MSELSLITRAETFGARLAIVSDEGSFSYTELATAARAAATAILQGRSRLDGARVALMVTPGFRNVAAQWGTWAAGGVSVPLALTHPAPELEHVLDDAGVSAIVASAEYLELLEPLVRSRRIPLIDADRVTRDTAAHAGLPDVSPDDRCLILYTSGTTGRPKGVVWRYRNLQAQLSCLSEAWAWSANDRILLVLPLHHVHGLVNVLTCALWNGAAVEMLRRFDAVETWDRLGGGALTVFMAVPTIYRRLIQHWEDAPPAEQGAMRAGFDRMRLMVSGSAALPVSTLERWREITGHTLLERYGMTEIGMALSNPYQGTRTPGAVGNPLPTVEVRLVDEDGYPLPAGRPGEIEVRGPSVFSEYWERPEDTAAAFHDEWFRTGDEAVFDGSSYRILGRQSVDIIKSGGEKVSALEVEDVLRTHPAVGDCAVVGIEDDEWGERIVAAIVPTADLDVGELRGYARSRLAPAKVPRQLVLMDELPRNALGKVMKPQVKRLPAVSNPEASI